MLRPNRHRYLLHIIGEIALCLAILAIITTAIDAAATLVRSAQSMETYR